MEREDSNMKKLFRKVAYFFLFTGLISYSPAFGEIDFFEIAGSVGASEIRAALGSVEDINAKDGGGMTALMWAALKNPNLEVIKILIDAGADAGITDNSGNTALDYAKKELKINKIKSEDYKLLWTKNPNIPKNTYFVELCGSGSASEVIGAIKGGADVNAEDKYGVSPIFWAAWLNSDVGVIKALIEAGANPNTQYAGGQTPLTMAAGDNKNPGVIIALLDGGADPKKQDASGKKAIDYAEWNSSIKRSKAYSMLKEYETSNDQRPK
jgi:ankyrin repeat protein